MSGLPGRTRGPDGEVSLHQAVSRRTRGGVTPAIQSTLHGGSGMALLAFGRARLLLLVLPLLLAAAMLASPVQAKPSRQSNNSSEKLRAAVTLEGVRRHQAAFQ